MSASPLMGLRTSESIHLWLDERINAVVGLNSAGKTTLIRIITMLIPLPSGWVVVDVVDVDHA